MEDLNNENKISEIMHIISNLERMRIIEFLSTGQANVNKISEELNIIEPKVSYDLSLLSKYKIVGTQSIGREHVYFLYSEQLEPLLIWINNISNKNKIIKIKDNKNSLNNARSCYDHLAGVQGVLLLEKMLEYQWLEIKDKEKPEYSLTEIGKYELNKKNIKIPIEFKSKRIFAYGCMDWTVKKYHLGGSLGVVIFNYLIKNEYIQKIEDSRRIIILNDIKKFFN